MRNKRRFAAFKTQKPCKTHLKSPPEGELNGYLDCCNLAACSFLRLILKRW